MDIKALIQGKIDSEAADIATYNHVLQVLQKYEGQRYWKRTQDKVKADLEALGYTEVSFSNRYGWTELTFHSPSHPTNSSQGKYRFDNGFTFMLWYDREATGLFRSDLFAERNTWASVGAPRRLENLREELKNTKAHDKLRNAQNVMANLAEGLEELYEMECFYEWRTQNQENINDVIRYLGGRIN